MDRCPSQWVWGQTSSEFPSGGSSHSHLQQAGRPSLFQAMMKKHLWWSSHGKARFLKSRLKNADVAETQKKKFSIGSDFAHRNCQSVSCPHTCHFLRILLSVSSTFFLPQHAIYSFLKQLSFPISNVPFHFYLLFRLIAVFKTNETSCRKKKTCLIFPN
ncbi:hypothetical protein AMECASPLE_039313 [Ameca splendens]|uniref:Uncharacterized protein n=1 Tax=Ameca splendens TaxID=208324 RepID=A0ABV0XLL6_9TELE